MSGPARIWVAVVRRWLRATYARTRAQLAALVLTVIVASLVLPGPWAPGAQAAKDRKAPTGEVVELRSATSMTVRQADGTLKTKLSQASLHYLDKNEDWQKIDPTFKASSEQGTGWESGKNRFSVDVAPRSTDGFVELGTREGSVLISLEDADAASGVKTDTNEVVFKDAVEGVDLEYVLIPDGLKENVVLRSPGAPSEYRFRLDVGADTELRAEQRDDGSVWFFGDEQDPAFVLLAPVVGDSRGMRARGGSPGSSFTPAEGMASLEVEKEGDGTFALELTIDEDWLRSEERVYPVVLDPTFYVEPDVADGFYNTGNPSGTPFVIAPDLWTGRSAAGSPTYATVLDFDLAAIPAAAQVLDVDLLMHLNLCFSCGGASGTVGVRRLNTGWSATTPWSAVGVDGATLANVSLGPAPTGWQTWSGPALRSSLQAMVNGAVANHGFVAEKTAGAADLGWAWRSARYHDPSFAPFLTVLWVADGVQLSPVTNLHANGADLFWQRYTGVGTGPYADAVAADTPSAYWRLDEGPGSTTAFDWSGNDRRGTYTGGYTLGQAGALTDGNTAVALDGGSGRMTGPAIPLANSSFTVELWAKRATPNTDDWAIHQGVGANNQGLHVGFRSGNAFSCAFWNNDLNTPQQYTDNAWHHWACTYDAATRARKIYRDGVLVASDTALANFSGTGALVVGTGTGGAGSFAGTVDDVAIYSAALAAARIQAHHTASTTAMPGFQRFEIHRSATPNFTPSASTLIGTVADVAIQTYRDTTAKPDTTFYYEVVTVTADGSYASNELRAELPPQGMGQVTIQPGLLTTWASGARISSATPNQEDGSSQALTVAASPSNKIRTLLKFDLSLIPSGAQVTGAKLHMYALQTTTPLDLHRVTTHWTEGGATWNYADRWGSPAAVLWTTAGGDFVATPIGTSAGSSHQHWDTWELGSLVQQWVSGAVAQQGVLLKYGNEGIAQNTINYAADGYSRSIALRPKLTINYADGSTAVSPTVAVSQPASGESVTGEVTVKAGALDDGRATRVEFFLDGSTLGASDTTPPFEVAWNTTTASRGEHTLTAKATDDAGNQTTSAGVTVTVANSAPPTTSVTSATPQSGAAPNLTPTASASANPTAGPAPLDVGFTGSGNDADGSIASYAWDLDGDGAYDDSTTQSPSFQYTADGLHYVRLRVTDDDGAIGFATPITIRVSTQVNEPPTAVADAAPTSGDAPLTVTFDGSTSSDSDGSVAAHDWDFDGDGLYDDANVAQPSHEYVAAGEHQVWLRATDDQGAFGFSGPLTITVGGAAPVSPLWDIAASASDDIGVSRVEFYVDGDRVATDTSAPYEPTLDTLALPVYDGSRTITTRAYDADGNVTTSADHPISVANTFGTKYRAAIGASNVPRELAYDPGAGTQEGAPLTVSVTNNSGSTWPTASTKLRYRWLSADATPVVTDSADVSIGADLVAAGQRNVSVTVDPPALPAGVYRARYKLVLDLYDTGASAYFAAKGNAPYETWVTATREAPDELGLERYQQYDGEDLGGGFDHALNLANGNNSVQWVPFSQPGRGLNTVVTMTYNSLENGSVSPLGNNWSLAISSLTPFGLPLDVHPNAADLAAGRTQKWVGFTDGDGSYHVFTGNAAGTYYAAPPGVHLYLRDTGSGWAVWKPDRTRFLYDAAGYPTGVEDANGNELTFTPETPAAGNDPYGLEKRVTKVTDAGGRDFTLTYFSKGETPTPAMRGKVKRLTDHVGHALELSYYEDGNLRSIREKGGPGDDGMPTPDREVFFAYTTPAGGGPAIGTLAGRKNPDPATVQSSKLYSVVDFRGNETSFTYSTAADAKKWRLSGRTNRTNDSTTFAYDTVARTTTATMPLGRVWAHTFDSEGRVTQLDDPVNSAHTTVEWADQAAPNEVANVVRKVTAPSGEFVEYAYNANGYKTDEWDELRNRTTFEYQDIPVDANDSAANWEPGRSIAHISQLTAVVKPQGNATPGNPNDYRWTFAYTPDGLVDTITDPLGNITANTWNANGTLASQTLPANGDGITRTTTFNSYDANGLATQQTDAAGGITRAGYAANGNLLWLQDPNHGAYSGGTPSNYRTEHYYDAHGRPVSSSQPKSTAFAAALLVWEGAAYDPNDNEVTTLANHYGRSDGRNGAPTTTAYDAMDRPTLATGPRSAAAGGPVKNKTEYDAAGRVMRITEPKGVNTAPSGSAWEKDHVTETAYDLLDREHSVTQYAVDATGSVDGAATRTTKHCYDDAGDLRSVTGPKGAAALTTCPDPASTPYVYASASHTTKFEYDAAHREVKQTDALGRVTQTAYDANGEVLTETDETGKVTTNEYDTRGLKTKTLEPFDTARVLTSLSQYDALGNLERFISPRAFDAAGGQAPFTNFVESYSYDALERLVKTTLPNGPGVNQYFGSVIGSGPTAYWRFGGSGVDSTGNGYNLQALSGSTNAPGALSGDPDTAVACGGGWYCGASYPMGFPNVSVEAWVKTTATVQQGIAQNPDYGFVFRMTACGSFWLKRHVDAQRNGWTVGTGCGFNDGNWHHVVALPNGNADDGPRIYVDGQRADGGCWQCGSGPIFYDLGGNATEIMVGGTYGGDYFTGSLDEMAIYSRVLSGSEIAAHYAARAPVQAPPLAFMHQAYDANGNTLWASLPTHQADPNLVPQSDKTTQAYWDTGSIHSSQDQNRPKVRFDYTAEGWQSSRIPEMASAVGVLDLSQSMFWQYHPDGLLESLVDQQRQRALYTYDANGNKMLATEATGLVAPGQTPLTIDLEYNSLDELAKVRTPKPAVPGTFLATTLAYDSHGNTSALVDNREENGSGAQTAAGRTFAYTYDAVDQVTAQTDDFGTADPNDDEQLTYTYTTRGELDTQTLSKRAGAAWDDTHSSVRTYFDNGLLKTLTNRNGASPTPAMISQHTLGYIRDDVYLNGNRVSDTFFLKGPDSGAPCWWYACTTIWSYDARERLTHENVATSGTRFYTLDVQGNVTQESGGGPTVSRTYSGQQLMTQTTSGVTHRFIYDSLGNQDCTVKAAYVGSTCPAGGNTNLIDDNAYDYKSRLTGHGHYNGAATASKVISYTNDPLDRPLKQVDQISGQGTTTYDFTYVGVTNALSKEFLTGATNATKRYAYDAFGERATIAETKSGTTNRYAYVYDPHPSVELLIDQNNVVKESYGYTAYGVANTALTRTAAGFDARTNPYRYTGKRLDTGSGTYDMGARRYSVSTGRFLQYDMFYGALDDLSLAEDPLTQNRYALAGANPVNFIEIDGHWPGKSFFKGLKKAVWDDPKAAITNSIKNPVATLKAVAKQLYIAVVCPACAVANMVKGLVKGTMAAYKQGGAAGAAGYLVGVALTIAVTKKAITSAATRSPKGHATGPGAVPKSERDPKRLFTQKENAEKLREQGGVCLDCRNPVPLSEARGHHKKRHADGGRTVKKNHAVLCKDCHDRRHRRPR